MIVLPIHFDVGEHSLALKTFLSSAEAVDQILMDLNQKFFEGKVDYRLLVLPPEPGSFKQNLAIAGSILTCSWLFLESDIGKGYVKGLTGHEPAYWSETAGEGTKELVLLKESVKGVLEKTVPTLMEVGVQPQQFWNLYVGKNKFYEACICDEKVNGVGFDESSNFPVRREKFIEHTAALNSNITTDSELKIHDLIIVSPVTAKNSNNMWKTKDKHTKEQVNFYLKDDEFYLSFIAGLHPLKETENDDEITALIRYEYTYQGGVLVDTKKNAIKIFRFNQTKIAEIPEDLESLNIRFNDSIDPSQMNLFPDPPSS
jgi:hypothetical protein